MSELLEIRDDDRYSRLRLISWWDQSKLRAARVMVVGAGALGNEVLKNLALLGVGSIFVVDFDTIEDSNLSRSVLFRAADNGREKAAVAAERTMELNPDVRVEALTGDIMLDVGLGRFADSDVVIGCLDNREARLWVNRSCWKVSRPWVDGGIQEISGVVKVFVPPDSACYECGMTDADYRLINLRYSCPLLKREQILEGKTPTAPTVSSMIAGMQVQEALKLLHGMPVDAGCAAVFNGNSNNLYTTAYQRQEECLSHETWGDWQTAAVDRRTTTARQFLTQVGGAGAELVLEREFVTRFACPTCRQDRTVNRLLARLSERDGRCPGCGEIMQMTPTHRVAAGDATADLTLAELGVPEHEILRVRGEEGDRFFRLTSRHGA